MNVTKIAVILFLTCFILISMLYTPVLAFQEEDNGFIITPSWLNFLRYNRVEGAFIGNTLKVSHAKFFRTAFTASVGYGVKSEKWRYALILERAIDPFFFKKISVRVFDDTRSNDEFLLSDLENNLATLFLKEDFRDYYQVRGFESAYENRVNTNFGFEIKAGFRKYNSMSTNARWSAFKRDHRFRPNPSIALGEEILVQLKINYNNRESSVVESNYWNVDAELEHEFNDYTFTGVNFALQRIQLSLGSQTFLGTLKGGFREGTDAEQYLFDLGGIGTLRGYDFKEFTGSRMLLVNLSYRFNGDLLQQIPLQRIPFYSWFQSEIFYDAGMVWVNSGKTPKFIGSKSGGVETGNDLGDVKSNIGFALLIRNGTIKVDFARKLDSGKDPWRVTFRLFQLF